MMPSLRPRAGDGLLHAAAAGGDAQSLQLLHERGLDVEAANAFGPLARDVLCVGCGHS